MIIPSFPDYCWFNPHFPALETSKQDRLATMKDTKKKATPKASATLLPEMEMAHSLPLMGKMVVKHDEPHYEPWKFGGSHGEPFFRHLETLDDQLRWSSLANPSACHASIPLRFGGFPAWHVEGFLLPCHIPGVLFYEITATTPVPSSSIPRPSKTPITNQDESSGSAEGVVQSPLTRIHRSEPRREKTAICSQLYQSWKGVGLTQNWRILRIILYHAVLSSIILYDPLPSSIYISVSGTSWEKWEFWVSMFKHVQTTLLLGTETHEQGYILINIEPLFQINNLATNQCCLVPQYSMHHAIQLNLPGTWCTGTSRSCQNIRSHTLASDLWHDSLFPQSAMNPHGLPQSSKWSWRHRCNPRTWEFQGFAAQYELPEEWKKHLCIFSTEPSTLPLWPLKASYLSHSYHFFPIWGSGW